MHIINELYIIIIIIIKPIILTQLSKVFLNFDKLYYIQLQWNIVI